MCAKRYPFNKSWRRLISVLIIFLQSACVPLPAEVTSGVESTYVIGKEETIASEANGLVIFPYLECLTKSLKEKLPKTIRLIETQSFLDALYPWLESEQPIASADDLNALLTRPKVQDKISELGVRFLITPNKQYFSDGHGGGDCAPPEVIYAGCYIAGWGKRTDIFDAIIWDLHQKKLVSKTNAKAKGRNFLFIFAIIPFMGLSDTEGKSCNEAAARIAEQF